MYINKWTKYKVKIRTKIKSKKYITVRELVMDGRVLIEHIKDLIESEYCLEVKTAIVGNVITIEHYNPLTGTSHIDKLCIKVK